MDIHTWGRSARLRICLEFFQSRDVQSAKMVYFTVRDSVLKVLTQEQISNYSGFLRQIYKIPFS
jgi:hypothetical protein